MITITGATGKIGSKAALQLLEKGKKVKMIGRNAQSLEFLRAAGAETAIGSMKDVDFLTSAFDHSEAVLLMLPPDKEAFDFGAFQDEIGEAQVKAIEKSGVKNIVFISSQGAHDTQHTGTVKGLGRQEARLQALANDVNVLSLRPEAFMENTIESLKLFNTIASPLRPEVSTGLVATSDIARFAAEQLQHLAFVGKTHQDLLGDRNYNQWEVTEIVGKAIGRPSLTYVCYSYEDYKASLLKAGMSESRAGMITERYHAINEGYFNQGVRDHKSTTPTTLEYFAETVLKPLFKK